MTSAHFRVIRECRLCGFSRLASILYLGDLHVSNFVDTAEKEDHGIKAPLELVLCNKKEGGCGLLQLRHTVFADAMFRNYWYRSGINQSMTDELRGIAEKLERIVPLVSGDRVIDIGSNDGTLLRAYRIPGLVRVGFEPARNLTSDGLRGITKLIVNYFNLSSWRKEFGAGTAKIITAIAMFYDLDDPNSFVADVVECLDDEGVWVIQMMYLPSFLRRNAFDGICHEHLEYYSLLALEDLLCRHRLEVCDIEMREHVNEGSIRVYVRKTGKGASLRFPPGAPGRVEAARAAERALGLDGRKVYDEFVRRVTEAKRRALSFIEREVANGKKIHGYAASTKGNTTLQFYGLTPRLIEAIADRNPAKWGTVTVGTKVPVISEADSRARKPDYYFILAWHFLPEFVGREIDYLKGGGKFIVPMPEFRVIGSEGVVAV